MDKTLNPYYIIANEQTNTQKHKEWQIPVLRHPLSVQVQNDGRWQRICYDPQACNGRIYRPSVAEGRDREA